MSSMDIVNPDIKPSYPAKPSLLESGSVTTIACLPAELLCLIFDECFAIFKSEELYQPNLADPPWHFISDGLAPHLRQPSTKDAFARFRSPSRFPYGLASVSQFWSDVLSTQPVYWQQAILSLDPKLTRAWDSLEWSRNLPIDVVILRDTSQHQSHSDDDEASIVEAIMELLYYHLPRCRSVYFETNLGSSLPIISKHIQGRSQMLSSLLLRCQVGDTEHQRRLALKCGVSKLGATATEMPHLRSLVLDGKNFDNTFHHWLVLQTNLEQLIISNYPPSKSGLTVARTLLVIQTLPNLLRLKLQNVNFEVNSKLLPSTYSSGIRQLHLEAVPPLITQEIFRLCDFDELDSVCFTRCAVDDLPYCNLLILDDIQVTSRVPLDVMLLDWEGSHLWIGNCQGFNDDIFDMLRKFDIMEEQFRCPWMEKLHLYNLPPFSLKKLKKMIKRRNHYVAYGDPDWMDHTDFGPAISTLHIEKCEVRELTTQDIEWFTSHVAEFTYVK